MEVTDEVGWRKGMAGPQGAVLGIDSTPRHEVMEFSSPFLFCTRLLACCSSQGEASLYPFSFLMAGTTSAFAMESQLVAVTCAPLPVLLLLA